MAYKQLLFAPAAALIGTPAAAQLAAVPHSGEQSIIGTGERPRSVKPPHVDMSDWRVAETPHVFVFSKGDSKKLQRVADHLEKLHFLLSMLLNRVDTTDNTLKLQGAYRTAEASRRSA